MAELKRKKTAEQALRTLMNLCAKSEKSTGDAYRLLFSWGVAKEEHDKIVERLLENKFIDDRRYAEAFVRDKMNFSRWGGYKIRAALRNKKIDENIINEVLAEVDGQYMDDKLERQLLSKMKSLKYKNSYELRAKLIRYGSGLGFEYDNVCDAIDRLMKDIKDEEEFF